MKKKRIFIIVILLVLMGGYYLKKEFDKKKLIETEGPRIEKYIKYNYKEVNSVVFTDVILNPTGIAHIKGYINDNKESKFDAGIYDEHFNSGLDFRGDIPEYRFKNYETYSVEEIETEEKK